MNQIDIAKKLAREKEGECMSIEYINAQHPLIWKCKNGHIWNARIHDIKRGTWCRKCAMVKLRKYTIENMIEIAKSRNGLCLSNEYRGITKKLRWRCGKGHEWKTTPKSILIGNWCPICGIEQSNAKKRKKITINEINKLAKLRGGECTSKKYVSLKDPLEWMCKFEHKWSMSLDYLYRGSWCPNCTSYYKESICRGIMEGIFNVDFPKVRLNWLRSDTNTKMELDGYNDDLKIAFEHNGIQHYIAIKPTQNIERRKQLDQLKVKLCNEHDVVLIVIPYNIRIDDIQDFILQRYYHETGIRLNAPKIDWNTIQIKSTNKYNENIYNIIKNKKGVIKSEDKEKIVIMCKNGHEWLTTKQNIGRGRWCKECYLDRVTRTIDDVKKIASERNGELISTSYINTKELLTWKCNVCNHQWNARLRNILSGRWCPSCAKKRSIKNLKSQK